MFKLTTEVLVVGGGPVGLTLAMDLAQRGTKVVVLEARRAGEAPSVKCNHVAARTMEQFRRMGIARQVRDAGLPADFPHDVSYRITTTGVELSRIPIPSRARRFTTTGGPDTDWPTPEPPHRINQIFLEPVLYAAALATPGLTILDHTRLLEFTQGPDGVEAVAERLEDGTRLAICARYMVGCDGARSEVRRAIGARFVGDPVVQRVQSTHIRAPDLISRMQAPPAWATFSLNPRRSGNMYAIDGRETWLIHNYLRPMEEDFEAVDRDASLRAILGVGEDFRYDIVSKEDWIGRRLVADRFRDRRVFICGDAAHIWVPMAGYGMNAGIADALNLSWMLAATLAGWGGPRLLDAHEAERQPITEQVSRHAMDHAVALTLQRTSVPENIEDDTPEGDAARAKLGRAAYDLNVNQYCCGGLNFGYFYEGSPVISADDETAPGYTMAGFTPSTVPGCRTPHLWLRDGRSLYDACGSGFTLLRRDTTADPEPILDAARARGVPMTLVELDGQEAPGLYIRALTLSRPDGHVAWRGNSSPADASALIDLVRGA